MPAMVLANGLPPSKITWTTSAALHYMGCLQQVHNVTLACLAAQQYAVFQDWLLCAPAALSACSKAESSAHLNRAAGHSQSSLWLAVSASDLSASALPSSSVPVKPRSSSSVQKMGSHSPCCGRDSK